MSRTLARLLAAATLLAAHCASATTHYVAIDSTNPVTPFITWDTAATNIQDAIDVSVDADTVLVSNGVYATGGRIVHGAMTNRVVIDKPIIVQSVNGPAATIIKGAKPAGNAAVRCAYVTNGATLSGFTLTNGATRTSGLNDAVYGGGAWCETDAVLTNCVLTGNLANSRGGGASGGQLNNCTLAGNSANTGGGARGGTLNNCTVTGNSAGFLGGGVSQCTLNNCILIGNSAGDGGGADRGTLNNCNLIGNSAGVFYSGGGGEIDATLRNCIAYSNSPLNYAGFVTISYSCTTPLAPGTGNFTNAPMLFSALNPHLMPGSPCIDAGTTNFVFTTTDIDGDPRIEGSTMDVGCDEYSLASLTGALSVAIATPSGTNGQIGVAFSFEGVVTGALMWAKWSIGDGTDITNQLSISRTFAAGGLYSVVLTVSNFAFTASATTTVQIAPFPVRWISTNSTAWDYSTTNWLTMLGSEVRALFATGVVVRFDDNTTNVQTNVVIGSSQVLPGGIVVDCSTHDYSISGKISGSGRLTKSGSGRLLLRGTNTFSGGVNVNGGSLVCANGGTNALYTGSVVSVASGALYDLAGHPQSVIGLTGQGVVTSAAGALTLNIPSGSSNQFAGVLAGGFSLIKGGSIASGLGQLVLTGTNSFTGDVIVNAGPLLINNSMALGMGSKSVILTAGTAGKPSLTLDGTEGSIVLGTNLSLNTSMNVGTITNLAGDNAILGGFTILSGGGDTTVVVAGGSLLLGGNMMFFANNRNLILSGVATGTVSGEILAYVAGPLMGVTKRDAGTWTLAGSNSYPGQTLVSAGYLRIVSSNAVSTNCPLFSVETGAVFDVSALSSFILKTNQTLTGGGTILGSVGGSGTVTPGVSGTGTLTVVGTFAPASDQTLDVLITDSASCSKVSVAGGAALGGKLTVSITNGYLPVAPTSFEILNAPSISGTFAATNLPPLPTNREWRVIYSTSNVTLSVIDTSPKGYDLWATAITNGLTNYTDTATGDGYPNLLKYATGSSATNSDELAAMAGESSNGVFSLCFNRNTNASDVTLVVEGSDAATNDAPWLGIASNLNGSWGGATNVFESGSNSPVSVSVADTVAPATNRFLRLRVTRP